MLHHAHRPLRTGRILVLRQYWACRRARVGSYAASVLGMLYCARWQVAACGTSRMASGTLFATSRASTAPDATQRVRSACCHHKAASARDSSCNRGNTTAINGRNSAINRGDSFITGGNAAINGGKSAINGGNTAIHGGKNSHKRGQNLRRRPRA
eukprot:619046-Rhodomonas_salina.5